MSDGQPTCENLRSSEQELQACLQNAGRPRRSYEAKLAGVNLASWILELSMVKQVERFKAKLKFLGLGEFECLGQRHIKVVEPRAVKEAAAGIPEEPDLLWAEQRGIEVRISMTRIRVGQNGSAGEVRHIDRSRIRADQSVIVILR